MKDFRTLLAFCALVGSPAIASAQSLDLTVHDVGISIGDSRRVTGLRINFRDLRMEEVTGINITLWTPYERNHGIVRGLALGIPATGAERIDGIAAGIFGVGAGQSIRGLALGGIGLGAGEDIHGIALGGIGMGVGEDLDGLALGGVGMGVGRDLHGIAIGGIGAGIGEDMHGLAIGGIGVGVGENATGIVIGGIGGGIGGNMTGLSIGGIGIGGGGDVTGVQLAGVGIGAGGTLKWLSIAGLGIGAERIEGVAIAAGVGAQQVRGLVVAPIYFKIPRGGRMKGVNMSAYNDVRGTQQGLAIGIFNYARSLDGLQLGLLNYAGNKSRGTRLLPIVNYARDH